MVGGGSEDDDPPSACRSPNHLESSNIGVPIIAKVRSTEQVRVTVAGCFHDQPPADNCISQREGAVGLEEEVRTMISSRQHTGQHAGHPRT